MPYFEFKDYPALPNWLVAHLYNILDQKHSPITYDENFKERMLKEAEMLMNGADQETLDAIAYLDFNDDDTLGGQFTDPSAYDFFEESLAKFDFIPVDNIVFNWVKENIPEKIIGVNLQVMHGGEIITPHIDELRHYALNYTLDRGGDSVQTCFYEAKPEWSHQKAYARTLIPFKKLNLLAAIEIPEKRWHKIDINVIHSVMKLNPNKKRIALSVSIAL